ncbi:MAG: L-threonylcarbamoyladenylate synthase [Rehaibacterium terrae]|uniref:L-threonylcarbamoyladenylate synthase n=1 Tax=Rehaibacterium terrae TaxID=1341696 RepID=UPI003918E2D5
MPDRRPTPADIDLAVIALRRGEAIGLPTETVYGLAADAANPDAVRRIFALKGRPADHPLIVHLPDVEAVPAWARDIPDAAWELAQRFWPGPLTLILKRQPRVSDEVTGGQDTVGLRVPAHPVAQAVLQSFGGGLAAPSANRFGRISPTRAEHVREEFGDAVPVVLDGGECEVGIESTIVDLSGRRPRILRPGMIGRAAIEAVIGPLGEGGDDVPRASGMLEKHYAPRTPLRLVSRAELASAGRDTWVLALATLPKGAHGLALPAHPDGYAHGLYAALRELDASGAARLLVERPPDDPRWLAVHDRLRRAAAGAGPDAETGT